MRANGVGTRVFGALALAAVSVGAQAQFSHQLLVHPKAAALGNAVTADPPGIMAIRRNPAGLSRLEGRQWELGGAMPMTQFDAEFTVPEEGCDVFGIECAENDPVANSKSSTDVGANYIPGIGLMESAAPVAPFNAGFSVQPPGSKLTFGNAAFIENSGGFSREEDDPGRYQPTQAAIQRITYLSPTVSYEVNDEWTVGAGIHFSHQGIEVNQLTRAPNMLVGVGATLQDAFGCDEEAQEPLAPWLALCGGKIGPFQDIGNVNFRAEESLSTSYKVGVLWEPTDWFTWGAQYSSGDDMNLKGDFQIDYTEDWAAFWQSVNSSVLGAIGAAILSLPSGVPKEEGHVSIKESYPQHFSTGVSMRVLPFLTLNADMDYVDLSSQKYLELKFDRELEFLNAARILSPEKATPTSLKIGREFTDVWNLGYGATLHVNDRLDLRAGAQKRSTVIPKGAESLFSPIGDGTMYGVGLGYRWSKDTQIDMSLSRMKSTQNIPADSSCNINCTNITNIVYNPYAGLDVKTETTLTFANLTIRSRF